MNLQPKDIEVSLVSADHERNLGQWSMQTYSGVVLYHKPTGIEVKCTKHKSQYKNKAEAMRMLGEQVSTKVSGLEHVLKLLTELKTSLGSYEGLTLKEYDILYGDVEEIQHKVFEVYNDQSNS